MIRAALIDMDGTLYDSMPLHSKAWEQMAADYGMTTEPGEFFLHEGRTGADVISILIRRNFGREATEQEKRDLYKVKAAYFNNMPKPPIMAGMEQVLATLKRHGLTTVLVTGSSQPSLLERLERDFPGVFPPERMVTANHVKHSKPHPEPYLMGMEKAGLTDPQECLVIENAPIGVRSGRAAGMFTVGVSTGPIPTATLLDAGADKAYGSMPEFAADLERLLASLQ